MNQEEALEVWMASFRAAIALTRQQLVGCFWDYGEGSLATQLFEKWLEEVRDAPEL